MVSMAWLETRYLGTRFKTGRRGVGYYCHSEADLGGGGAGSSPPPFVGAAIDFDNVAF